MSALAMTFMDQGKLISNIMTQLTLYKLKNLTHCRWPLCVSPGYSDKLKLWIEFSTYTPADEPECAL